MTKKEKISFYKLQIDTATQMIQVAEQNKIIATRLKSEAKMALELLGSNPEPKNKQQLDDEFQIKLLANLTKGVKNTI